MRYKARIYVTLRSSVLDPAGTAVQKALEQQGDFGVSGVRIGKFIEVWLEAKDAISAHQQTVQMCEQFLVNPVIEEYCSEIDAMGDQNP